MSNPAKKAVMKAIIDATITELMYKTTGDQVYLNESTTVSAKIAEMITAINTRTKTSEFNAAVSTLTEKIEARADSEEVDAVIAELISKHDTDVVSIQSRIKAVYDELTTAVDKKANQTDVDALESTVEQHTSQISSLNTAVGKKANQTDVDDAIDSLRQEMLGDTPVAAYDTFTEMAAYIESHADASDALTAAIGNKADLSYVNDQLDNVNSELNTKANQTDVDALESTVEQHTSQISSLNTAVGKKANQTDVDALESTVEQHTSQISDINEAIQTKSDAGDVTALQTTVNSHTTQISNLKTNVDTKAEQSDLNTLQQTVGTHTSQISALESDVATIENSISNVDNTADANKSVKYAASAGTANSATTANTAGTCTGNAATATELETPRTIRTNLASTLAASFDGSTNVTPGVTGILPIANGGTGVNSEINLRKMLFDDGTITNYIATFSDSYKTGGYATPKNIRNAMGLGNTTGALPIANGGTGANTAAKALTALGAAPASSVLYIESFDSSTGTLVTKSADYTG